MGDIAANLANVRERIAAAARRCNRDPREIRLLGVTKTVSSERVERAIRAGLRAIGENRVQETAAKLPRLSRAGVEIHLIGRLQSNKARRAVELFDVIQTMESVALAARLDRIAGELGRQIEVLAEVNLGGESSKAGATADQLPGLIAACAALPNLRVTGLMAIPPYHEDAERSRPYFRRLRELLDEYNRAAGEDARLTELSMGMSHDFEIAIEEGATIVRIGTAIFGERPAPLSESAPPDEEGAQ